VADDGRLLKVLSTPDDPSRAVAEGLSVLAAPTEPRTALLCHGTTVATNALLERRGGRVALVTTAGFADVIEIGRQDRPSLYDIWADRPETLVPRPLRFEVRGRLDASGAELEPLDTSTLSEIPDDVEAVAVCLLHADLDGRHEEAVAAALADRLSMHVVCSSDVSPEFREYERTVTTVIDAYLRPVCHPYMSALTGLADDVLIMTSEGGLTAAADAAERPVALLLSGPAGGVRAGASTAVAAGFPDAVTFDMGGTSTDVCLVLDGRPEPAAQRMVAGLPVRLPALDIHTVGAGGGSIARLDPGGALRVGPESAGAQPGPACYGRGGTAPTVTDADLVLGRIPTDAVFPGLGRLDLDASRRALNDAGVTAEGVVAVVDAAMERAVRVVSVERGLDPRQLALVAFGGAGPLHACAIAEALDMPAVIVPPRAGVLSAVGVLCSPRQHSLVRSWPAPADHRGAEKALAELAVEAKGVLGDAAQTETALDCRYAGQSHELTVSDVDAFHEEHRRRNGFARPDAPVEVVALRAVARLAPPLQPDELPAMEGRRKADGPAVLAEPDCTVWLPDGWYAEVHEGGSWILRRSRS
jgi:N-methylhydantoinase A/oxoprolinase/acetone carboxylase beta subunit